jgi:hypothetical protein
LLGSREAHIDFFVEARGSVGMGHLSRVASLMKQLKSRGQASRLHLFADHYGKAYAKRRGLNAEGGSEKTPALVAVIDAVTLPRRALEKIAAYPVRIVISPSFKSMHLATHYFARSLPISGQMPEQTYVDVNADYAFVTSASGLIKSSNLETIKLGICMTAGRSTIGFQIAELMLTVPAVREIRIIASDRLPKSLRAQNHVIHCRESLDPWSFFSNCNRFIGGDGLMVSEAVAMLKPTFSLVSHSTNPKNLELISRGAIFPFTWDDVESGVLSRSLIDEGLIQNLIQACNLAFSEEKSEQLAWSILRVLRSSEKGEGS